MLAQSEPCWFSRGIAIRSTAMLQPSHDRVAKVLHDPIRLFRSRRRETGSGIHVGRMPRRPRDRRRARDCRPPQRETWDVGSLVNLLVARPSEDHRHGIYWPPFTSMTWPVTYPLI